MARVRRLRGICQRRLLNCRLRGTPPTGAQISVRSSSQVRRALTTALDLQGVRRVPGVVINCVVRQRLMDGVGGVIGLLANSYFGALNEAASGFWDLVVWITKETGRQA